MEDLTTKFIRIQTCAAPAKAAFVVIVRRGTKGKNKVLLQMRSHNNRHGSNKLGLPGGRRDRKDKEDTKKTAIRETYEETQIQLRRDKTTRLTWFRGADIYGSVVPSADFEIKGPLPKWKKEIETTYGYHGHRWFEYSIIPDAAGEKRVWLVLPNGESPWQIMVDTLNKSEVLAYLENPPLP